MQKLARPWRRLSSQAMVPSPTTTALKRITAATASTGVAAERIDIHIMTGKVRVSPLLRNSAMGSAGVRAAERRRRCAHGRPCDRPAQPGEFNGPV